jgi:hypothetical protein
METCKRCGSVNIKGSNRCFYCESIMEKESDLAYSQTKTQNSN